MKKKRIVMVLLTALLVAGLCGGIVLAAGNSEEILLSGNQRYVYGYITSIQGNEVTYMEVEESVITAMLEPETETSEQESEMSDTEDFSDAGEMPDMGSMPESGGMPDMSNMSSDGERGQRGGGRQESGNQEDGEQSSMGEDRMQFGGMSATVTTYIPVGVTVHTAADVSTTFSRLASGDLIKILVETNDDGEDVIEEIWMLQ